MIDRGDSIGLSGWLRNGNRNLQHAVANRQSNFQTCSFNQLGHFSLRLACPRRGAGRGRESRPSRVAGADPGSPGSRKTWTPPRPPSGDADFRQPELRHDDTARTTARVRRAGCAHRRRCRALERRLPTALPHAPAHDVERDDQEHDEEDHRVIEEGHAINIGQSPG